MGGHDPIRPDDHGGMGRSIPRPGKAVLKIHMFVLQSGSYTQFILSTNHSSGHYAEVDYLPVSLILGHYFGETHHVAPSPRGPAWLCGQGRSRAVRLVNYFSLHVKHPITLSFSELLPQWRCSILLEI